MEKIYEILGQISVRIKDEVLLLCLAVILILTFAPDNGLRYIILAIFVVGISAYVFVRQKTNRLNEGPTARVHVESILQNHYRLLEIANTGTEDIVNFLVKINWQQKDGSQERIISRFYGPNDNPIKATARGTKILGHGERIYGDSIPLYSVDGNIKVLISGVGAVTGKKFEYSRMVENEANQDA